MNRMNKHDNTKGSCCPQISHILHVNDAFVGIVCMCTCDNAIMNRNFLVSHDRQRKGISVKLVYA